MHLAIQWLDPAVFTAIMLMCGLLVLLIIRFFTGGLKEKPHVVVGDLSVALIISVVLGPLVTHYLSTQREFDQRQWNARTAHLERLRPIVLSDAAKFTDLTNRISSDGHIVPINATERDKYMDEVWFQHILIHDLRVHFAEFFKRREESRAEIARHDSEILKTVRRVAGQLSLDKGPNEDRRIGVAYALVRRCIGKGTGIALTTSPDGAYFYRDGAGGSHGNSGGAPPPHLIEAAKAFQEYAPDRNFESDCDRFKKRMNPMLDHLINLTREARSLAEIAGLTGDCPYTRVD